MYGCWLSFITRTYITPLYFLFAALINSCQKDYVNLNLPRSTRIYQDARLIRQFETPFKAIVYSGDKGIACRDSEIWIINNWHNEIDILDKNGNHIGVAEVDFLQEAFISDDHRMPMCLIDERMVIAIGSQVKIYSVEPEE